jgi:hypothetical protein
MFRKTLAAAMAAAVCLTLSTDANAGYFTTNGDVELSSTQTAVPPLDDITSLSGPDALGFIYTNQVSGVAGVSGEVRTVSVQAINSAILGQSSIVVPPSGSGQSLIAVSGISGTLTAPGETTFTSGRLMLYAVPEVTYLAQNPSTFTLPADAVRIAEYTLGSPGAVFPGPVGSAIVPQAAADINVSSIAAFNGLGEGQFVFLEDSLLVQNDSTGGDNFLRDVKGSNGPVYPDGLFVQIEQSVRTGPSFTGQNGLDAADLDVLNSIAIAAGLPAYGFATGFGSAGAGTATDFFAEPAGFGTPEGSGDFFATLDSTAHIIASTPEPGSVALFCIGLAAAGFVGRRKRQAKAAA